MSRAQAPSRPTERARGKRERGLVEDITVCFPLTHDEQPKELVLEGEEILEKADELVDARLALLLGVPEVLLEELRTGVPVDRDDGHVEREARGLDEHLPVVRPAVDGAPIFRSEEHTSELQSLRHLVCRL